MKPQAISPLELNSAHIGMVITRDQRAGDTILRKGHAIVDADLDLLALSTQPIHVVRLEEDDVPESIAVPRIAEAIRGPHTTQRSAGQGRTNISSAARGLLCVDDATLLRLNQASEIGIFTHYDGTAVNEDTLIAGIKIAPVAMSGADLDRALAGVITPVIDVLPFQQLRVTCLVTESLQGRVRDRFEQTFQLKMAWYGADLRRIVWLEEDAQAIAEALSEATASSDLVLTAGSHMMDPLDASVTALDLIGARMIRMGAPAHPGSMVWMAHHDASQTPILSLASCSMFSQSTVADLLLPYIFAGQTVTSDSIARLGHGGLLDRGMDWRFPPYGEGE